MKAAFDKIKFSSLGTFINVLKIYSGNKENITGINICYSEFACSTDTIITY